MVQLCNKDVKSHQSYFCIPPYSYICFCRMHAQRAAAREQFLQWYLYVCMHFNHILHHEHAKMMVLWRMFLRLKRSSVDTPSLLLPTTGFFSWQAGRNFPLPSAILSKIALASSSRSLTSSHLGDSGVSLQCHETVLLWVSGLSVLEGLAVYMTKSMYAALQVT